VNAGGLRPAGCGVARDRLAPLKGTAPVSNWFLPGTACRGSDRAIGGTLGGLADLWFVCFLGVAMGRAVGSKLQQVIDDAAQSGGFSHDAEGGACGQKRRVIHIFGVISSRQTSHLPAKKLKMTAGFILSRARCVQKVR
jgi:hypothetical protein